MGCLFAPPFPPSSSVGEEDPQEGRDWFLFASQLGKLSVLDFDAEKDDRINIAGYGKWEKKKFS